MTESTASLKTKLEERFSNELIDCIVDRNQVTLVIPAEHIISVCKTLRDDDEFAFSQLSDLCGVDYSTYGQVDWATQETTSTGFSRGRQNTLDDESDDEQRKFAVVYHLLSLKHNIRLRLRCYLN
ncbi:MAG: NADH-quinone oxidoreductase subunit C, partial [Proteobacteria bacterium]|nr:NADH-quinone oxidoreductase subunit C [Pseudomonadota bacterium]